MPVILLVRHGENDYVKKGRLAGRLPGVHLNERGRAQAQAVAAHLAARLSPPAAKEAPDGGGDGAADGAVVQGAGSQDAHSQNMSQKGRRAGAAASAEAKPKEAPPPPPKPALYTSPLERAVETGQPLAERLGLPLEIRPGLIEVDFGEWQDRRIKGLGRTRPWKIVQLAPSRFRFPGGESFTEAQCRIVAELDAIAALQQPNGLAVVFSHSDPIKLAVAYYMGMPLDLFQRLHIAPASITALALGEMGAHLLGLNYEISFTLPKS